MIAMEQDSHGYSGRIAQCQTKKNIDNVALKSAQRNISCKTRTFCK